MSEILKKPVHLAILKPTHVEKLSAEGKLPASPFGVSVPSRDALPKPPVESKSAVPAIPKFSLLANKDSADLAKKNKKQVMLRVLYEQVPPIPEDKKPPCESCKTSACCVAFVVNITKEEYESGLYGDNAVALTPEIYAQLKSAFILPAMVGGPVDRKESATVYFLEGKVGERCPFLTSANRCGIYDIRPVTCRTYSCVGDPRITDGIRQGTEPILAIPSTVARKLQ